VLGLLLTSQRVVPEVERELKITDDRNTRMLSDILPYRFAIVGPHQRDAAIGIGRPIEISSESLEKDGGRDIDIEVDMIQGRVWSDERSASLESECALLRARWKLARQRLEKLPGIGHRRSHRESKIPVPVVA
jgi:hypothetical protein